MVTGFTLEPSYVYSHEQEISVKELQEIAKRIGKDQKRLHAKCVEYGLTEELDGTFKLSDLLKRYEKLPTEDLTCYFTKEGVSQSAAGGDPRRSVREVICRAFAILVLDECYKQHKSVSFSIH